MKRQRWKIGAVVEVPLQDGWHAYAQMLGEPEYAFFDVRSDEALPPEAVVTTPVLFRLWVMRRAHSQGRWRVVGQVAVSAPLQKPVARFNQDPVRPSHIVLVRGSEPEEAVTPAQCISVERAAVWDPEHVEERLRDHFVGRPNRWVEQMRVKAP